MGFIEAIKICLNKYVDFKGRARRSEYWFFFLFTLLVSVILGFAEGYLGIFPNINQSILANIFALIVLLPAIGVGVRRLHDTNHSGWWYLLSIIPIIGFIILLIWLCKDSDEGDNRFGSNPK
tara:strand:- start:11 stop:376 length:366 start_codon:yes stop_codon:yes gene_type:complete